MSRSLRDSILPVHFYFDVDRLLLCGTRVMMFFPMFAVCLVSYNCASGFKKRGRHAHPCCPKHIVLAAVLRCESRTTRLMVALCLIAGRGRGWFLLHKHAG